VIGERPAKECCSQVPRGEPRSPGYKAARKSPTLEYDPYGGVSEGCRLVSSWLRVERLAGGFQCRRLGPERRHSPRIRARLACSRRSASFQVQAPVSSREFRKASRALFTQLPEQRNCTEKFALYPEYWNRYHFKMTPDAVQPPDKEPLVGRTSLVESNPSTEVRQVELAGPPGLQEQNPLTIVQLASLQSPRTAYPIEPQLARCRRGVSLLDRQEKSGRSGIQRVALSK
jgi:hypothetical protein